MEYEPRTRNRVVFPLIGVLLFLAPAVGLLLQHDLEATQTVGLQRRARRHLQNESQIDHQTTARCALKPEKRHLDFEQCAKEEGKRDDAFFRPMPKKPHKRSSEESPSEPVSPPMKQPVKQATNQPMKSPSTIR